ncbi:helix-turn-helix domain-containing protein [Pedobacter aquatilis]|uniref:helix-turn-helix domain-containing protein n=1 Tax=Pedobacter aquatilis TaxID=351343 RepID=UPI002931B727|nr:helix-turn-helix domain-containing protein [Pedobacter aquatilis]
MAQFPVLNIDEFNAGNDTGNVLLYHELIGKRIIDKPHKHDFFLFMLFEVGSGNHDIDFIGHKIENRQLHMLFPEQVHRWELEENTHAHQIMMNKNLFEGLANFMRFSQILYKSNPVLNLRDDAFDKVLYEFKQIKSERAKPVILWDIIHERIKIIALIISREAEILFNNQTVYKTKPILLRFLSLIEQHYNKQKLVSFYASELNISANYLNILCRKYFNTPATTLIHERLILESKRMLLTTTKPIKAIAFDLGFYDVAYFSKFFRSKTGITPNNFRAEA